jgi:hypothetical protein
VRTQPVSSSTIPKAPILFRLLFLFLISNTLICPIRHVFGILLKYQIFSGIGILNEDVRTHFTRNGGIPIPDSHLLNHIVLNQPNRVVFTFYFVAKARIVIATMVISVPKVGPFVF